MPNSAPYFAGVGHFLFSVSGYRISKFYSVPVGVISDCALSDQPTGTESLSVNLTSPYPPAYGHGRHVEKIAGFSGSE